LKFENGKHKGPRLNPVQFLKPFQVLFAELAYCIQQFSRGKRGHNTYLPAKKSIILPFYLLFLYRKMVLGKSVESGYNRFRRII